MPTAPLIRLVLTIYDNPSNPFLFESFLNVAASDQAQVLEALRQQEQLFLAFYGDDLTYRYTKVLPHNIQPGQQLDHIIPLARDYWLSLPTEKRDFDLAKLAFLRWSA